jgi:hypothetical protein
MDVKGIKKELVRRGATKEQAEGYITLLKTFEKQSKGEGQVHHALPQNCGWWERIAEGEWNKVIVKKHLHVALHAYRPSGNFPVCFGQESVHRSSCSRRMLTRPDAPS